jgi:hypothetical protein
VDSAFHPFKIVEIFLHHDVAAAGEYGILIADQHSFADHFIAGILRAVNKSEEIAVIEVSKAVHFIHLGNHVPNTRHDLRRKLETQIHVLRSDVEQQFARRGRRMARSGANLAEGMQLRRSWCSKKLIPRSRSKTHDARKPCLNVAKFTARNSPLKSAQNDRKTPRVAGSGFSAEVRKIAARESGAVIG